jgi:hypothetical protein
LDAYRGFWQIRKNGSRGAVCRGADGGAVVGVGGDGGDGAEGGVVMVAWMVT